MSSVYSPWETSDSAGGDLTGTMSAPAPPSYVEALQPQAPPDPMAALGQFQAAAVAQQQEQQPGILSYKTNAKTGTSTIEVTNGALAEVMAQLSDMKTMKTAAMARVAQLRQQEASGSPILDALSQIAGGLAANDPTMPGWVRALGATSLQMGPQGIKRERMAEEAKVLGLSKEIADTSLAAEKLSEYNATMQMKMRSDALESRRVAVAEKAQAATERNQIEDNYRADLRPVFDVIGKTGIFNADHETAIRQAAANHPGLPSTAVDSEIAKAKANAAAAKAEIDRKAKQRMAEIGQRASIYAGQIAAQEGKQIRGQVVRANLAQASKMAEGARIDEKEALRLQGLNEMAIAADRMKADLESDPTWQGVVAGRIAETAPLTTAQQKIISNSADLFVKKMSSLGISFAKTSDAEMKKILATVPTATMTVAQAKRLLQIMDDEGRRAAQFIAERNWAESPESIASALPDRYRSAGLEAHARKTSKLTPQQRLAYGLSTGDEGVVQQEVERAIAGTPGQPVLQPPAKQNSTRPGEIRMAAPSGGKKRVSWEDYAK